MSWISDKLFAIDPRSLGLFRFLFGLSLLGNVLHRWDWVRAFYSNEGVLPNHNHLFLLKDEGKAWSVYHAFSNVGEGHFALLVTTVFVVMFTIGFKTKAFHFLLLVCFVSLNGRNVLIDSVGDSLAIALLALTIVLPLGAAYGVDSMRKSFAAFDEKTADELNDRSRPELLDAPFTLAFLGLLVLLGMVYYGAALQQTGETWQDGSALWYALHVDRWTSGIGVSLRDSAGLLSAWTKALWAAQLIVVPLAIIPLARQITRPIAIAAMVFHALTFGLLFTYGMYGWSLLAASALLIPSELWARWSKPNRKLDVYYDDDCGVCLWFARLLKRVDARGNITFLPNSGELPDRVSDEVAEKTMLVVDAKGNVSKDALAWSHIMLSCGPLLRLFGVLLRVPGITQLARFGYYKFADNRFAISEAFGMGACAVPPPVDTEPDAEDAKDYRKSPRAEDQPDAEPTPAQKIWRLEKALFANAVVLLVVLSVAAQSERTNPNWPLKTGLGNSVVLGDIATWSRVSAHWGIWAPDPPKENAAMVVDAETRGGWKVDVLTGYPPDMDLNDPPRARKGVLWEAYLSRIVDDEYTPFRKELRRYLTRGGYAVDVSNPQNYIAKMKAYWVTVPTPPPGQARNGDADIKRQEIVSQRGRIGPARPSRRPGAKPGAKPAGSGQFPLPSKLPPFFPKPR